MGNKLNYVMTRAQSDEEFAAKLEALMSFNDTLTKIESRLEAIEAKLDNILVIGDDDDGI